MRTDKRKTGDLKLIQSLNRHLILDTIRRRGPISRSKIAERIGLSPTTVASAVSELIHEGLVSEMGAGESSGGRKPILLRIDLDTRFIIGVSITHLGISIAELNLEAEIKKKKFVAFGSHNSEEIIAQTLLEIGCFCQSYKDLTKCLGISIISSGIVDEKNGVILYNSKLGIENVPLKQLVEERTSLETWLDNDVNAIVLAEKYLGGYLDYNHLIYLKVSDGIGAGIIAGGSVLRGFHGGAGEFGHTTIDWAGTRCHCGNIGCIGTYSDWSGVYSRISSEISNGTKTVMMELANGHMTQINPSIFQMAIRMEDALAKQIMEEQVIHLSAGIVNLVNLFNPQVIFLGGQMVDGNTAFMSLVKERVYEKSLRILTQGLEIRASSFGENDELIGAAAVILQDVFQFSVMP